MPPTPIRPLVDRILGGRLDDMLRDWKAAGVSFPGMAARLYAEHGIEVTDDTIRKWYGDVTDDTTEAAS